MDLIELTEAFLAAKQDAFSPNTRLAYRYDLVAAAFLGLSVVNFVGGPNRP